MSETWDDLKRFHWNENSVACTDPTCAKSHWLDGHSFDRLRAVEARRQQQEMDAARRPRPFDVSALWDENGRQRADSPCEHDQGDSVVLWYDSLVDFKQALEARATQAEATVQRQAEELQTLHENLYKHLGVAFARDGNTAFLDGAGEVASGDLFLKPDAAERRLVEANAALIAVTADRDRLREALENIEVFLRHIEWNDRTSEDDAGNLVEQIRAALAPPSGVTP